MHTFPAHRTIVDTLAPDTVIPLRRNSATHRRTIDTAATLTCRTAYHAACHVHRALARCPPRALARCPLAQPRPTRPPHSPRRTRRVAHAAHIAAPLADCRAARELPRRSSRRSRRRMPCSGALSVPVVRMRRHTRWVSATGGGGRGDGGERRWRVGQLTCSSCHAHRA